MKQITKDYCVGSLLGSLVRAGDERDMKILENLDLFQVGLNFSFHLFFSNTTVSDKM